jgi:hypothetical protein
MAGTGTGSTTVSWIVVEAVVDRWSRTPIAKLKIPVLAGVPEIIPVAALRLSPGASPPAVRLHV